MSSSVAFITPSSLRQQRISIELFAQEKDSSMSTALCIIPPGPSWDTIQRARHVARDGTYHKWPPAIRLFHPFCPIPSDVALDVARIVERHGIKPFSINLNNWVIIPHMEAMEQELEALQHVPCQDTSQQQPEVPSETDLLIEREERIGRERLSERLRKKNIVNGETPMNNSDSSTDKRDQPTTSKDKPSPKQKLEKQQRMYEEFNGPCVVCLEPDLKSRAKLMKLREILKRELFQDYNAYSPTSSVTTDNKKPAVSDDMYRPVLPIGQFSTVTSAIETARKLKGLWEPLTFDVTDLHFVSILDNAESSEDSDERHTGMYNNRDYDLTKKIQQEPEKEVHSDSEEQFGCDAMVLLMGEEVEMDKEENKLMVEKIMREGIPGGSDQTASSLIDPNKDTSILEGWLDNDDGWDEGTVLVIGRTHFFTGEKRMYVG